MSIGYWNPLALNSPSSRFVLAAETDYHLTLPFQAFRDNFQINKMSTRL